MAFQKRKRFLINKDFQIRVALYVVGLVILFAAMGPLVMIRQYDWLTSLLTAECLNQQGAALAVSQDRLMALVIAVYFCFLLLIFMGSIVLSHRIAGPFEKLKNYLGHLGAGQWNIRMSLRKDDFFQEAADHFNQLATQLDERMSRLRGHLEKAQAGASPESKKEIEAALALCQVSKKSNS